MSSVPLNVRGYPRLHEAEELLRKGATEEASFKVIEHLREHRDEPRGLALLGEIAIETGGLLQAEHFLRRSIALGNTSLDAERSLATCILKQNRLVEAVDAFAALETQTNDPEIALTRAMTLDRLGRSAEAIAIHERIIRLDSEAKFWILYGHSLRFAGRTDDAVAAYRHVVERDPERGEAWWSLADIKSKVLTDEDMETMQSALAIAVDVLNIVPLHMALGRGWHDRGEHERAFGHYREGNRLRADLLKYNPDELTNEVDEFLKLAPTSLFGAPGEPDGPNPVFLLSLPRSGSTLLEQMLNCHPSIEATGELPYIRAVMRDALEMRLRRQHISVPEFIEQLDADEARALGAEYLRRASHHLQTDARYFIDKMPTNWSDILFIRKILPNARFIEIRRDPMDCCFSNYSHHFGSAHAPSFDLVHQARSCLDYWRFMDHIVEVAPDLMCSIRYEELVEDPQKEITKALDYLGLEWDDSLLRFYESDRIVRTPSAEQVRRPINRSGIGTWKPYAKWLGPLTETLGPLANQ
jgi:tetratricopeptide (TPR) repeat protein